MASEMDSRPPRKGSSFRDVIVVASIAIIAIFAYPRIEPFLPETWRSNIAAILGGLAPSPNPIAQGSASVVSDVNLRVEPSTTAEIITTLPRGLKVTTIERRGDWMLVQVEGNSGNARPQRGWVFGSFLISDVNDDVEPEPSEESESE
jgi:hypothetical protein